MNLEIKNIETLYDAHAVYEKKNGAITEESFASYNYTCSAHGNCQ